MEDYNRVIKGEGIRFWPVRAFNFKCVLLSRSVTLHYASLLRPYLKPVAVDTMAKFSKHESLSAVKKDK
jgi:hypothetical protein